MARAWRWCAVVLIAAGVVWGEEPIRDEGLRRETLAAVWPGAKVSVVEGKRIDDSYAFLDHQFPDAMKDERVYRVVGPPRDPSEECAAEDIVGEHRPSRERLLRMRAWTATSGEDLVAIFQYQFLHNQPALACESIARAVHLVRHDGRLQVERIFTLEMTHHHGVQGADLMDLSGHGTWGLAVQSDFGGGGTAASELVVLGLYRGELQQWLNVPSQWIGWDAYSQKLDLARTRATSAAQFCFVKTTLFENGEKLATPRVTRPCYPRFTGEKVDER